MQLNRNSAPRAAVCFPPNERIPLRSERNLDERPIVSGRANTFAPEPTNCVDVPEYSWMAGRIGTFLSSPILPPSDAVSSVMLNEFADGTDRIGQRPLLVNLATLSIQSRSGDRRRQSPLKHRGTGSWSGDSHGAAPPASGKEVASVQKAFHLSQNETGRLALNLLWDTRNLQQGLRADGRLAPRKRRDTESARS